MGPQFDFWYVRTMLEFAQEDNNGNWYGIVQRSARSALHRAHDKHGLYLRTWYGKKASRAGSPKGSLQLHAANAALFAWMAAARPLSYGPVPAASSATIARAIPKTAPIE